VTFAPRDIEEMLVDEGWLVVRREASREWWIDEIWTLESGFHPIGARAYVAFIVDPQAPPERARGEHVWAVWVGREHPAARAAMVGEVPLAPDWKKIRRAEVAAEIRRLRLEPECED
jgi:hypothetical protein